MKEAIKNRSSNAYGKEMRGKHTGGTIPFVEHSARLKRVRGEVHPGHVYNVTHRKKGSKPNEFGAWVNVKYGQIYLQHQTHILSFRMRICKRYHQLKTYHGVASIGAQL